MFLMSLNINSIKGENYTTFQEVEFEHMGAKLLEDYTESDYKRHYDKIKGKKFWGWKVKTFIEDEKCSFIQETLYVIHNEGTTAIDESIKFTRSGSKKLYFGATGSLELSGKGTVKGFKLGLGQKIGTKQSLEVESEFEEVYTLKMKVDPNTKLTIAIAGEGKVSNGVGKYYRFFKNVKKGGWEVFVVTTEYYSIIKEKINEEIVEEVIDET